VKASGAKSVIARDFEAPRGQHDGAADYVGVLHHELNESHPSASMIVRFGPQPDRTMTVRAERATGGAEGVVAGS